MADDTTFYGSDFGALQAFDPEIAGVLVSELDRIRGGLQLIASENISSPAVLTALGSTLSNKYAEGYPGRRYYGGCSEVDKAEEVAIERAKQLFGADHANVQAHSGASANQAVYGAFLQPGDTFLAMSLPMGGHLTHGSRCPSRASGSTPWLRGRQGDRGHRLRPGRGAGPGAPAEGHLRRRPGHPAPHRLRAVPRHRRRGGRHLLGRRSALHRPRGRQGDPLPVPYADVVTFTTHKVLRGPRSGALVCKAEHAAALDKAIFPMMQGGPQMHTIAAKAVNFKEAATPEFAQYAKDVIANSRQLAESLGDLGIRPTTGGTDTHLSLLDLQDIGVTGKDAEARADAAGIVLNKNAIPFDPQKPNIASGMRGHAVGDDAGDGHRRDEDDRPPHPHGGHQG